MKTFAIAAALFALVGFASPAHAEETVAEKATVAGKDVKRAIKKGANRVEEGLCGKLTGDSKASCLAKEAKNRATEVKDGVVDKTSEVKNAVDSDGK
ncbi:MAG: hypothetical protein V4760_08790 [Bdellovibrionota bacterium]